MMKNKRALGLGLTQYGAYITYPFILIIAVILALAFTNQLKYDISSHAKNSENSMSFLNILRMSIDLDDQTIPMNDLIALGYANEEMYGGRMKLELVSLLDTSFGVERCTMICVENKKILGSGCIGRTSIYDCGGVSVKIPNYLNINQPISVSFNRDIETSDDALRYIP